MNYKNSKADDKTKEDEDLPGKAWERNGEEKSIAENHAKLE